MAESVDVSFELHLVKQQVITFQDATYQAIRGNLDQADIEALSGHPFIIRVPSAKTNADLQASITSVNHSSLAVYDFLLPHDELKLKELWAVQMADPGSTVRLTYGIIRRATYLDEGRLMPAIKEMSFKGLEVVSYE